MFTYPFNICRYEYVTLFDYDDIIMPVKYKNWADMINGITKISGNMSSFHFKNFYFMDEMLTVHGFDPNIPEYLHMLQHIYRTPYTTGQVKSIHKADDLVALGCHEAQKCFKGKL